LMGGGCINNLSPHYYQGSYPENLSSWRCGGHGGSKTVYIICCN
jgi:hypothetical protein